MNKSPQLETSKPKTKEPSLYNVVLLNDDYTPMEFVGLILTEFFGMNSDQSDAVVMQVHTGGKGIAGVFTHDVATTKADLVITNAIHNEFPLKAIIEEV